MKDTLPQFTLEEVALLQLGLDTLATALQGARRASPEKLEQLRKQLKTWASPADLSDEWPPTDIMPTEQVAEYLGVTTQQVQQLGAKQALTVARPGRRGRGGSALYTTESVRQYAKNRPPPGRKPARRAERDGVMKGEPMREAQL